MLNKLPILYKRTATGATQTWQIIVENNTFYTVEGQLNGALTQSKPTVCYGKNGGKANETSDESQALAQATAKQNKKLKTGYTTDINQIDTCRTYFEAQLAKKFVDFKDEIKYPVLTSEKLDGHRMVVTKDDIITRKGERYYSCPHISKMLIPFFAKYPEGVIDGEIYSMTVPFEKLASIVRKKKPTAAELAESERIAVLWIFDGVIDDQEEAFQTRFEKIKNAIRETVGDSKHYVFVENEVANCYEDVIKAHNNHVKKGMEGAMIRIPNAPYENKRSSNLLKFKMFIDTEYEILDVVEGQGDRSGMAGSLQLKLGDGRTFGSGIKGGFEYYKELLTQRASLIGKMATIRYQELSADGIPRFPVAVNIDRFDI